MELQLVSFTQAKTLKSIGMPVNIQKFCYAGDGNLYYIVNKDFYPAPTLELAAKWLREEKDVLVYVVYVGEKHVKGHCAHTWEARIEDYLDGIGEGYSTWIDYRFLSYEEALSAGIDKAIEILKLNNDE